MARDFGAGMSVDELIGMPAWTIAHLNMPPGEVFQMVFMAAKILMSENFDSCLLVELWGDGHSVWAHPKSGQPVVVSSSGQITRTRS